MKLSKFLVRMAHGPTYKTMARDEVHARAQAKGNGEIVKVERVSLWLGSTPTPGKSEPGSSRCGR